MGRTWSVIFGWLLIAILGFILLKTGMPQYLVLIMVTTLAILIYISAGIFIINEWERVLVLRLGKFKAVKGPGIIFVWPIIETVPRKVSLRLYQYMFTSERTLTRDNIPISVDAVVYYRVVDVEKAILNVENYILATEYAAQTSLREVIGKVELDELLAHREKVAEHIQEILDEKTETWGVKVTSVELRDIAIPEQLQEAIALQARAERERRARVILAQAEVEAAEKMLKAAEMYLSKPLALDLRWMNILYEIGRENSTLMLIPTKFPLAIELPGEIEELLKKILKEGSK